MYDYLRAKENNIHTTADTTTLMCVSLAMGVNSVFVQGVLDN